MTDAKRLNNADEYPVAKLLNDNIISIFSIIRNYQLIGHSKDFDSIELNRIYVQLVNEISNIYTQNVKLSSLKPEPAWKQFDVIKGSMYEVQKYLEENDDGTQHSGQIDKLCIIEDRHEAKLSEKLIELDKQTKTILAKYNSILFKVFEDTPKEPHIDQPLLYIPKYFLTYKPDGTILVNNVLTLKKVHAGSLTEKLLESAFKQPNILFKPDISTARNLSTILNGAGFTTVMKNLFFPIVSDDKGILFRPEVTFKEAIRDRISTGNLDKILLAAGATSQIFHEKYFFEDNLNDK